MNMKLKILEATENLIKLKGYNSFSYRDISEQVKIKTSSIHYHFSSKEILVLKLLVGYKEKLNENLKEIDVNNLDPISKIAKYLDMYHDIVMDQQKICLSCVLASEINTLPLSIQNEIQAFFDDNLSWLERIMGELSDRKNSENERKALTIFSMIEGGMITSLGTGNFKNFASILNSVRSFLNIPSLKIIPKKVTCCR